MSGKAILMVTSVLPRFAGDSTPPFVLNQAKALTANGWRIVILAPHGSGASWRENVDGVEILRFPYFWPLQLQKLCYEGGMLINFRTRPWTKLLLPFFGIAEFVAMVWTIWRQKPDLLHTHSLLPQGWIGVLASSLFDLPHIATAHGNDVFGLKKTGLMGAMKRWTLQAADLVTANSLATRQALMELGCPELKSRLVPAATAEEVIDSEERIERVSSRICFVGRLIEQKGVGDLLHAFAIVARERPNAKLVIVGEGQNRDLFQELSQELEIADHCQWTGWLDQREVRREMMRARIVVVPSRVVSGGWREAQGLVVVEGMLAGATIVASRAGGIPDMVTDRVHGRLTAPDDPRALAQVLLELFENESETERLAAAGTTSAREHFSVAAVTRRILSVYSELLT